MINEQGYETHLRAICPKCGLGVPVVQDQNNKVKFYVECPKCGWSTTLTAKIEDVPRDLGGQAE